MYRSTTRPIDKLLSGEQRNAEEQTKKKWERITVEREEKKERIKEQFFLNCSKLKKKELDFFGFFFVVAFFSIQRNRKTVQIDQEELNDL